MKGQCLVDCDPHPASYCKLSADKHACGLRSNSSANRCCLKERSRSRLGQPDLVSLGFALVAPSEVSVKASGAAPLSGFKPDLTMVPKQLLLSGMNKLSTKPHPLM